MLRPLWLLALILLMAAACSKHQPPVQMMAEARAAIQAAHDLHPVAESDAATKLQQADQTLHRATLALSQHHYDQARHRAQSARDLARAVIRLIREQKTVIPKGAQ